MFVFMSLFMLVVGFDQEKCSYLCHLQPIEKLFNSRIRKTLSLHETRYCLIIFNFYKFLPKCYRLDVQRGMGTIYGLVFMFAFVIIVYIGHLTFPLLRGAGKILSQMQILSFLAIT